MDLKGKKILVTGATGFIGGRLAERLALEQGAEVTGVGRRLERVPWLTDCGVNLKRVDLIQIETLKDLVQGHDLIFNLAAATGPEASDPELCRQVNVDLVENLVREASKNGVERTIHVSSIAVYGPPNLPRMTEDHPLDTDQEGLYGRTKAIGDSQAMKFGVQLGHDVVIIRPGQVFGPRGRSWTLNLLALIKKRVPVIFGGGEGYAHPVYVDNLIDGMIMAAAEPDAVGQAFNFVDTPLPWNKYLGYYGRMCGRRPWGIPLMLSKIVLSYYVRFSGRTESVDDLLNFYTNKSVYPLDKARSLLAYEPRIDMDQAMALTESWLQAAGYLNGK